LKRPCQIMTQRDDSWRKRTLKKGSLDVVIQIRS